VCSSLIQPSVERSERTRDKGRREGALERRLERASERSEQRKLVECEGGIRVILLCTLESWG